MTLETFADSSRLRAVLWLTATVLVVGPVRVGGPSAGLDHAWISGLNLARQADMHYGRELIFTSGPWGFLDVPLALSRLDFGLGMVFSVASVVATWLLIKAVLGGKLRPNLSGPTVSLLTAILSGVSSPSFLFAAAAALACVHHLRQQRMLSRVWCPVAVAVLAALLLQIKFSEGVAVTVFAFLTSVASPRARLMRTASSGLAWVVTFLLLWLVAGQSISDIGPWLRASTDLVAGYASAMSQEEFAGGLSLGWWAMATLLIVSVIVLGRRRLAGRSATSHLGSVVVTGWAIFFGFKQAFTRHDPEHNAALFVILAILLCTLMERGPRWRATAMLITLSSVMASPPASTFVRSNPVDSWVLSWQVLTNDRSWSTVLKQARAEDQAAYELSPAMVEATLGHSVSVDPWEVSMVWAYSMRWSPMPVFQSYAAYTSRLDQLNADAAKVADDDQMILRATTNSTEDQRTSMDGRNPMWEAPRYTVSVVCNYSLVTADKRWMVLRKDTNRCGRPSAATPARQVSAGEPVPIPGADADQIVTASFVPTDSSRLVWLAQLIFKGPALAATMDGESFRLPDGLASGPLLMVLPRGVGWPSDFTGHTSAKSISFSRPGKIQFQTVHLIK